MSISKPNTERSPSSDRIKINPFFDDFVDCIENLPSRLQLLLSELRNVDVLVKARHRRLHTLKLEVISKNQENGDDQAQRTECDNLLNKMHQLLLQCQTLGDQKVRLTSQIIELIGSKTRHLGLDPRTNEAKFQLEIDEEKVLSEFRSTCKKNRPINHHYYAANSSANSRSSTRQFQNLTKVGTKQSVEMNKKVYNKKTLALHRDMWNDDSSNLEHSSQNSTNQPNGHLCVKKKPLNQRVNQPCASLTDSRRSFKKINESKNSINDSTQLATRSKRQLSFCKGSNDLAKKTLNQSLKLSRKRRLSLSKKPQSSGSSSSSHHCKSPSSISSFSSMSSSKNKYLTNNTNNGNQSNSICSYKNSTEAINREKVQKENIKMNSKNKNNKTTKRLGSRGRAKSRKFDTENGNQDDSEYESDDEKSLQSELEVLNEQKTIQIKIEAKEDQLERNSNETESIKNLDEEENEPNNEAEEDRPAPRSKRIKQEVDYSDDIRKKSTRITRNNHNSEVVTKISKSAHDEPLYCTCREISYGQMIMCDNDACQIEWFHFNCVKLTTKPKGKWYCPLCRGDTHKVMKKSHLIQSSTSSSLSSPSYYASNYPNRCK